MPSGLPTRPGRHAEVEPADESGAPPGDRSFRPDVQGLRAVAVALVVLFHAGVPFLRGGYVGVDVFFVLSGFVITGLLLRRSTSRRGMGMVDFYARRARRILPMATVVIVATVVASYAVLGQFVGRGVADDARWTAVFLANVHAINVGTDYFHAGGPVSPLLHYWSLSVEEQFYLVFPMLLAGALVLGSRRARPRRVAMLLTGIVVSSLLLSGIQTRWSPLVAYFSPFTRAWELGLGGLCVLLTPWAARWPRAVGLAAGWIGLAGILAASTLFDPLTPFPGLAALLPVGATALVILAGSSTLASGPEVLLGRRSMQWGGDVSYSLYLWHWPVLVIAAEATTHPLAPGIRVLLVLAAVAMAEGSRRLVEDPVRHARALMTSTRRSIAMGALLVVGTLGLATVLVVTTGVPTAGPATGSGGTTHRPTLRAVQAAVARGVGTTAVPSDVVPPLGPPTMSLAGPRVPARCVVEVARQTSMTPCTFGDRRSTTRVLLLGDSTAAMWSSAFIRLASAQHVQLVLIAKTGCAPWLDHDLIFGGGHNPFCDDWHRFEVAEARRVRPTAIFVTGYVGEPVSQAAVPSGVTALLAGLRTASSRVTVLSNLPAVPRGAPDPATCVLVHPDDVAPCNLSMAAFAQSYGWFRASLEHAAAVTGSRFVNVDPLFCTSATCPMVVARHLVWRDLFHANVAYVEWTSRGLGQLLGPLAGSARSAG